MQQRYMEGWADESYGRACASPTGVYVVAVALFDRPSYETIRETIRGLKGKRRTDKLHWHEMDIKERRVAAEALARLPGFHVAAVAVPVTERRQERARSACLKALVPELQSFGVQTLLMEARGPQLDRRDVLSVQGARYRLPKGAQFKIKHVRGADEPLVWAADLVAGACQSGHHGQVAYRDALAEVLYQVDVAPEEWA